MLKPFPSKCVASIYVTYADNPILFSDPDGMDIYIFSNNKSIRTSLRMLKET